MKLKKLIAVIALISLASGACKPGRPSAKNLSGSVMLQGFHWESHMAKPWWGVLASEAGAVKEAGFDMVWFPPSGQAASDEGYLPVQLYRQESLYGTQDELKAAIKALHSKGVLALADLVLNHRVGSTNWGDFTNPQWGPDSVCSDDEWAGARGSQDTGMGYAAARDIDHTKVYVQDGIKEWLGWLRNTIGYDGWRYDFVKGFGAVYVKLYNENSKPAFSVVELWHDLDVNNPDPNRQAICNWIDAASGYSSAFDFTTKGMLQHAVSSGEYWRLRDSSGKPAGLIGWWPDKAVTFVDNHDTGPSIGGGGGQNHWPFPSDKIMQGYAYILTHPGVPCVYWPHYFDRGEKTREEIKALISLRKNFGINSESKVNILTADNSQYAAEIDGKIIVKIGPGGWKPSGGAKLLVSGLNYAVWSK